MKEQWKQILWSDGRYLVSDQGRIKNTETKHIRKLGVHKTGYVYVGLRNRKGLLKYFRVHVLVLTVFVGPRPRDGVSNHKDGVKTNNRLDNLCWTTQQENIQHALRLGLRVPPKGKDHYNYGTQWWRNTARRGGALYGSLNHRFGKPVSEETKNKIRAKLLGRKHSEETKRMMSITRTGRHLSAKTKRKIAQMKVKWWAEKKKTNSQSTKRG